MNKAERMFTLVIMYLTQYSRSKDDAEKSRLWGQALGMLEAMLVMSKEEENESNISD